MSLASGSSPLRRHVRGLVDVDVHSIPSADVADLYGDANYSFSSVKYMGHNGPLQKKLTPYEYDVNRIRASVVLKEAAVSFLIGFVSS